MQALMLLAAAAIPLAFLYAIHWLDLYGTDRPRIVMACVGWGLVAFLLSVIVNRSCGYLLQQDLGLWTPFLEPDARRFVGTRVAPGVEEAWKSLVLVYLVRRGRLTYFVDGAIYGFATGIGFAVIEDLRYTQLYPDNPVGLVIVRDFSSALAHGTMTAMTGIALGLSDPVAGGRRRIRPLLLGLTAAMTLHYLWNNFAYYSTFSSDATQWIFVGVGLAGVAVVAATILSGLRRERLQLRETLGMKLGVSEEEASVVQHLEDLDRLLAPIERRFGRDKCRQVADLLHLEAQLGLKEELAEKATEPELRAQLLAAVAETQREIDRQRRNIGVYVMLYVRSIFPQTAWSLWARLGQALAKARAAGRVPAIDLWTAVSGRRKPAGGAPGGGMYAGMRSELDARAQAAALTVKHVHELPEAMQKCMHWIMVETHVTVEHMVAGLGHHEAHAHAMLDELVTRGFLHRTKREGQTAFRARAITEEARAARPHLWRALGRRKGNDQS